MARSTSSNRGSRRSAGQGHVEARGKVIADYQDHLEESWIAELRARYDVEVNTGALHAIR